MKGLVVDEHAKTVRSERLSPRKASTGAEADGVEEDIRVVELPLRTMWSARGAIELDERPQGILEEVEEELVRPPTAANCVAHAWVFDGRLACCAESPWQGGSHTPHRVNTMMKLFH
jgi:hypothetical protein